MTLIEQEWEMAFPWQDEYQAWIQALEQANPVDQ
jgi:hypothetical protein